MIKNSNVKSRRSAAQGRVSASDINSNAGLVLGGAVQPLLDAAVAARAHGSVAIMALASIAADPDAPATARVAAASKLLERGYGRPGADDADKTGKDRDLFGLSDAEFELLLERSGGDGG